MDKEKRARLDELEDSEIDFIKRFILTSGSLKDLGNTYQVSYPTVRLRLDRLIQKIKLTDQREENSYIALIKKLAIDEKISLDAAKLLIEEYKREGEEK